MLWIERPLSATELEGVFTKKKKGLSSISYHIEVLVKFDIVKQAHKRKVRGATERFYYFTKAVLK